METLKVFISQPMRDKTDGEILEERNKIKELLIQKYKNYKINHLEFLDSFFLNLEIPDDVKTEKIYYLAKAIEMLSKADILFLAKGWSDYNGCNFEQEIFRTYKRVNEHTCIDGNLEEY